jgi:enoyl-CoA hydratase/carnithine racemase
MLGHSGDGRYDVRNFYPFLIHHVLKMKTPISLKHAQATINPKGIATLTILEAGSLNILSTPVIRDLREALNQLAQMSEIRTLILRGTGDKAFVAGANIHEMTTLTRQSAITFISNLGNLCEAVRMFPTPVIARIPGWCLGGGLELAMACDLRIAAQGSQFGMPEVKVGIPSVIHATLMPRLIGHAHATWMLLSGENIDTEKALQWGLIHEAVRPEEQDVRIAAIAENFAALGPAVLRQQKSLLRRWEQLPLVEAIADSVQEFGKAFDTDEPKTFMAKFTAHKANNRTSA